MLYKLYCGEYGYINGDMIIKTDDRSLYLGHKKRKLQKRVDFKVWMVRTSLLKYVTSENVEPHAKSDLNRK